MSKSVEKVRDIVIVFHSCLLNIVIVMPPFSLNRLFQGCALRNFEIDFCWHIDRSFTGVGEEMNICPEKKTYMP